VPEEKEHPKRPPRIQLFANVRPFYFVTFNTAKRRQILSNEKTHRAFINFAEIAHRDFATSLGRYVLMPDHVHLFVVLPEQDIRLGDWIKSLKSVLSKSLIESGIDKPHWQEGFFDHVLRSSDSYSEKWHYVRQNPVRAGLVYDPEDWPYQGEIIRLQF